MGCQNWNKGLKDSIDNNSICQISQTKTCYHSLYEGLLDFNKLLNIQCKNNIEKGDYSFFYKNYTYIGFPNVYQLPKSDLRDGKYYFSILKHLQKSYEPIPTEVLFIRDENPRIQFNIQRNNTLIHQLQQSDISQQSLQRNVVVLFIDNISRQDFMRKMPKTMDWISQWYKNPEQSHSSHQFFRYQATDYHTNLNMKAVIYGQTQSDPQSTERYSYNYYYSKHGFVTAQSKNQCAISHLMTFAEEFDNLINYPFDHPNMSMFCMPEYEDAQNVFSLFKGAFSSSRRCIYKRDAYEYMLEYSKLFLDTYTDQKKLLNLDFLDAHETTGENIKTLDDPIVDFLIYLQKREDWNNTHIILYSDHGHHHHPLNIVEHSEFPQEKHLPFFYYIRPKDEASEQNLLINEDMTVLGIDIHHLLLSLSGENQIQSTIKGQDILKPLDKDRKCDAYGVKEYFKCLC